MTRAVTPALTDRRYNEKDGSLQAANDFANTLRVNV